jgi:hypothetical protein
MASFTQISEQDILKIKDISEFCKIWGKIKDDLTSIKNLLNMVFPSLGKVFGFLIEIADKFCGTSKP